MRHLDKNKLRIVYMILAAVLLLQPVLATETPAEEVSASEVESVALEAAPEEPTEEPTEELLVQTTETGGEVFSFGIRPKLLGAAPTFTTGTAGIELIADFEGFFPEPYMDTNGLAIGYGSSFEKAKEKYPELAEMKNPRITEEQAKALMADELVGKENYLNDYITKKGIKLNQNQFDALISFTYNVGVAWMYKTNSDGTPYRIRALLEGNPANWTLENVNAALGTWVKANGVILQGLVRRRAAEAELFCTPWTTEKPDEEDKEDDKEDDTPQGLYSDVSPDAWYYDSVEEANALGIMKGDGNGTFRPEDNMKRAEMVKALSNMAGADLAGYTGSEFDDVAEDAWYAPAVAWAVEAGVVNGKGDGTFGPEESIRREHVCNIVAKYLRSRGVPEGEIAMTFTDEGDMEETSVENVYYCVSLGIINGKGNGVFDPKASATRAEIAKILVKAAEVLS